MAVSVALTILIDVRFTQSAEMALTTLHQNDRESDAYTRLVQLLAAIDSHLSLISNEAVHLPQYDQPTYLIVRECRPPGPTRIVVAYSIDDEGDAIVRLISEG